MPAISTGSTVASTVALHMKLPSACTATFSRSLSPESVSQSSSLLSVGGLGKLSLPDSRSVVGGLGKLSSPDSRSFGGGLGKGSSVATRSNGSAISAQARVSQGTKKTIRRRSRCINGFTYPYATWTQVLRQRQKGEHNNMTGRKTRITWRRWHRCWHTLWPGVTVVTVALFLQSTVKRHSVHQSHRQTSTDTSNQIYTTLTWMRKSTTQWPSDDPQQHAIIIHSPSSLHLQMGPSAALQTSAVVAVVQTRATGTEAARLQ